MVCGESALPTIANSSLSNKPTHDDDHVGEGDPEVDYLPSTLRAPQQGLHSPSHFTCKMAYFTSGAEGIRTPDLRRAKADT
jgi:hypothetical protein